MKFQLGPEIIASYKRLSYTPWYAFAEFVDNSTQSYLNNKGKLDKAFTDSEQQLTVTISFGKDKKGDYIRIEDNSIGMSKTELEKAVVVGKIPQNTQGRSKYGIGLKTAASWFGDLWTVRTKKLNEKKEESITVDVPKIANNNLDLKHKSKTVETSKHYTIIEIRKLNHKVHGRSVNKIKEYLSSIYRKDFTHLNLKLIFQDEELKFNYKDLEKRYLKNAKEEPYHKEFQFRVKGKVVKGWAAVFEKGSRKDAGFTILQADRVILGYPDAYKPPIIFGDQEGGTNNLVNQRLVGEIHLDGFEVSHTKDAILFSDEEKDILDTKLYEELKDFKHIAETYRKHQAEQAAPKASSVKIAINTFSEELNSRQLKNLISTFEPPPSSLIRKNNNAIQDNVTKSFKPTLKTKINDLLVSLYLVEDMSPNDPYIIIESTRSKKNQ